MLDENSAVLGQKLGQFAEHLHPLALIKHRHQMEPQVIHELVILDGLLSVLRHELVKRRDHSGIAVLEVGVVGPQSVVIKWDERQHTQIVRAYIEWSVYVLSGAHVGGLCVGGLLDITLERGDRDGLKSDCRDVEIEEISGLRLVELLVFDVDESELAAELLFDLFFGGHLSVRL